VAGDTLNIACNFLYCNHNVHRDFLITLYYLNHNEMSETIITTKINAEKSGSGIYFSHCPGIKSTETSIDLFFTFAVYM
jgi:hypothetical protein